MGRFKKYAKKQAKRIYGYAKKRYAPAGRLDVGKIASDVMKLKGIINSELKAKDVSQTDVSLATLGAQWNIYLLNGLTAQDGDTTGERHGMSVRFKSLQIKGRAHMISESSTSAKRVRMVIFIDKEPLVTGLTNTPPVTDLLNNSTISGGYVNSLRKWDGLNQKRFTVLYDRVLTFDDDYPERQFKFYKKLNMVTKWQNGYVADNAINNNAMYLAFITDTVGEEVKAEWESRVTFYDN